MLSVWRNIFQITVDCLVNDLWTFHDTSTVECARKHEAAPTNNGKGAQSLLANLLVTTLLHECSCLHTLQGGMQDVCKETLKVAAGVHDSMQVSPLKELQC